MGFRICRWVFPMLLTMASFSQNLLIPMDLRRPIT